MKQKQIRYDIEFEREADGRWIAEVTQVPGAMAYGGTKLEALAKAEALALRAMAERLEHAENKPLPVCISFAPA
jgi:predicted RNase H-like HicB family nuclease